MTGPAMLRTVSDAEANDIDRLTYSLASGSLDEAQELFAAYDAPAPMVLWAPREADLAGPLLSEFATACDRLSEGAPTLPEDSVSPEAFAGLERWLMIVNIQPDERFVYRYYGTGIAEHYGRDLTGSASDTFGAHISVFFTALYRAARLRKERVLSTHEPPRDVFVRLWRRLVVPMTDGNGRVTGFAVLNLPENGLRAGLELIMDPVFVVEEAGRVRFTNAAAREAYDAAALAGGSSDFTRVTGIPLPDDETPFSLHRRQIHLRTTELVDRGGMIERVAMTVSTVEHRGGCFSVIQLRSADS